MSSKLPEHYLTGRSINVAEYKVVSFVDSQSLISIVSEVEAFLQEALVEVLCCYPDKIGKEKVELKEFYKLDSVKAVIRFAAKKHVNEVMYKKPSDYRRGIEDILSLDSGALDGLRPVYVEAKARRDSGVHNSWKVNDIYFTKVNEVGLDSAGVEELSVDVAYLIEVRKAIIEIMDLIRSHCE